MKDHMKRVVAEAVALSEKLEKLALFARSDIFIELKLDEQELMERQLASMAQYLHILLLRIAEDAL